MKSQAMKRALALSLMLLLPVIGFTSVLAQGVSGQVSQEQTELQAQNTQPREIRVGNQIARGEAGVVGPPVKSQPVYSQAIPEITAEQQATFDRMDARRERAYKALNASLEPNPNHPVESPKYYTMVNGQFKSDETTPDNEEKADSAAIFFRNTDVAPAGASQSVINEPAHAQIGKNVFYTGNWYAARSANAGTSFTYVNPSADFPSFCCDQDVVHDVSRNLIIWYRQGSMSSTGTNQVKLGVSTNGGVSFLVYTWSATTFDASLTNRWFDYPHLAVSNNYLYLVTNVFNAADIQTNRQIIRMPLEALQTGAGFNYYRYTLPAGATITPVQGATTTMYFGSAESSAGTFRVYSWPENTTAMTSIARTIPAYTATNRDGTCTVPNGRNPCGRADSRVTAGWLAKGIIGFYWNVKQGGGFPYPYINAATFRESDKAYLSRPYIWYSGGAWMYGAAAPNIRGDLGIAALIAGGSVGYPRFQVAIVDDYAPLTFFHVAGSSNWGVSGSGKEGAGDYLRVRQFSPVGTLWTASGYYGTGAPVVYKGRFVAFGRVRESRAWNRWSIY